MCETESEIVREVSLSVAKALDECRHQFSDRHWNCSIERRRVAAKLLKIGLYSDGQINSTWQKDPPPNKVSGVVG